MQRRFTRIAVVMLIACGWSATAQANALSDSWKCAKNAGMSSVTVGADLYKKGEALAKDAGPMAVCLARTGPEGQALMVTSTALTALRLAKPSLLPKGQCESRIKGIATKPFANGIAALLPSGGAKNNLLAAANSDTANQLVWDQIASLPPPLSSVPTQIECGCLISDGALTLTDISEITNAISKTSQSCGAMLDSLGLGFINDIGSYAGKLTKSLAYGASGKWDEWVSGQSDPAAPGVVFELFYGNKFDQIAINMARYPADWQTKTYGNQQGWKCNYNMNSGKWEGQCDVTLNQLTALCADYYDEHKMSLSNGKKACGSYRDTVVAAATGKSKQYAAIAALPGLVEIGMVDWLKSAWLWRMPKVFTPGAYNYESGGSVSGWGSATSDAAMLRNQWSEIVGSVFENPKTAIAGQSYKATGILAIAKAIVVEVGNDPAKASALAFASTTDPLQDRVRTAWNGNRLGVARYHLRDWYPTQTWGFRYNCPGNLETACTEAVEAKFDKKCFTPISEHFITGNLGMGFPSRYSQLRAACQSDLGKVLASAAKLDTAEGQATAGKCTERATRDEQAQCNAAMSAQYRDCAGKALKAGKDDAGQCLAGRQLGADILKQLSKPKTKPEEPPSRKP